MTEMTSVVIPADVSPSQAPPPAEAAKPNTVLQDKFGGDVSKLASSYSAAETEMGTLRAKIAELSKPKAEATPVGDGDALLAVPAAGAKPDEKKPDDKTPTTPAEMDKMAVDTAKAAGLDYEALSDKFSKNGKLDDEDFAAFAKIGIPRTYVEGYLEDGRVAAEARTNAALTESGFTQETYKVAAAWASKGGLSDPELKAYNDAVNSGDVARQKQALSFLTYKHTNTTGKEPSLLTPDGGNGGAIQGYASKAQWQADIVDVRYAKDPAWRDTVIRRLAASPNLVGTV